MNLLKALGSDVKAAGRDKWVARCPVHGDKDFAMSIKLSSDGSVMAYCHACGANGLDLYRALGLDLSELFGERERASDWIPENIRHQYQEDKLFIAIFNSDIAKGVNPTLADKRRMRLAKSRKSGIEAKFPHISASWAY